MEDCGVFDSVESAFMAARLHAMQMWRRLWDERNVSRVQKPVEIELLDTEWGYDLRMDFKVVARFWVHDRTRIDPMGVRAANDAGAER